MKMIFCAAVSLLLMCFSMQTFACSLKGETTGGACSVKDIQRLENQRMQENTNFSGITKGEKNLRPVKLSPEVKNLEQTQCIFCLQEGLFGKEGLEKF